MDHVAPVVAHEALHSTITPLPTAITWLESAPKETAFNGAIVGKWPVTAPQVGDVVLQPLLHSSTNPLDPLEPTAQPTLLASRVTP